LPDSLAELRRLRLDFPFRERVRVVRPSLINTPQGLTSQGAEQLREIVGIFYGLLRDTGPFTIKYKKSVIKT